MQQATPSSNWDGESSGGPDPDQDQIHSPSLPKKFKDMQERKTGSMVKPRVRGFSLIEMMIVMVMLLIACSIGFITLQPALKSIRVDNAYNTTLATMRKAREDAIGTRRTYIVTFSNGAVPNTITITQANTGVVTSTYTLPNEVRFAVQAGFPTSQTAVPLTPDTFGTGGTAIDFDQNIAAGAKSQIYFYPDGSAQDVNQNVNNGVIYLCRPGDLYSSRAITLWGATGRLRGWRLYQNGSNYWRQM
jgi:prepilin-type N-terminal cleavage/methylation domain-containing protein